ncbi:MAG TPA: hypothetical protein VEW07_07240 [Solirubrobacterales bacterium]|nr:hypothetical protein [Solirubrobacterales bacterium]
MSRRATAALVCVAALLIAAIGAGAARADALIWRLEQPAPPAGAPFKVPLGAPGDLSFWAPNRGLLAVEGNSTIPRGIFSWNGQSWHQLATVCGGPGDSARIAWAGPTEFWVVSEPSLPRSGAGLGLCRFKDGQVVGSWSTRPEAADPFRQLLSATCNGPSDCWFGGVGSQDALGTRIGAFHLHWNGSDLESVYGPQGRGVSDMQFHQGSLYESTYVGRGPENRAEAVELAAPEAVPRLIHRVSGHTFANDPLQPAPLPDVPDDGTELLGLDSDGTDLWAVGGGAASGLSAPAEKSVARPPFAARLVGGSFEELELTPDAFGPTDRLGDVAAMRGSEDAIAAVVPFADRRSTNSKAIVARIGPDGTATTTRLPAAGAGRGSAARVACPAVNDCWMVTWGGWLFHYSDGTQLPLDTDPHFQGTIDFRPNEAAEQFVPDALPVDDSQLFAPAPVEDAKAKEARTRKLPPLLKQIRSKLDGLTLMVSFTVTRQARVALIAKRGGRTVARTPQRTFGRGRHSLLLQLSRERYPTKLAFDTKEVKR